MASARGYYKGKIPETQVFRGQAALIVTALSSAVSPDSAKTTAAIAKEIEPALQTRQDPERVVAFYMSVWKKKGYVRVTDVTVSDSEAAASNAANGAPQSVQEEVGGISADNHADVKMELAVETSADADVPAALPNLRGRKLSEAVVEILRWAALTRGQHSLTAEAVTGALNSEGYEFQLNQVNSAIQNLLRKEAVTKKEDGTYALITQ